jgi:hypothetical protein
MIADALDRLQVVSLAMKTLSGLMIKMEVSVTLRSPVWVSPSLNRGERSSLPPAILPLLQETETLFNQGEPSNEKEILKGNDCVRQ